MSIIFPLWPYAGRKNKATGSFPVEGRLIRRQRGLGVDVCFLTSQVLKAKMQTPCVNTFVNNGTDKIMLTCILVASDVAATFLQ
jgi:hypothetical protein